MAAKTKSKVPVIVLYRKTTTAKGVTGAAAKRAAEIRKLKCRVERPELLEHLLGSGFKNQEALSQSVIDGKADRILDHATAGWIIPMGSLGRLKHDPDKSTAESVRAWVRAWVPEIPADGFAVVNEFR